MLLSIRVAQHLDHYEGLSSPGLDLLFGAVCAHSSGTEVCGRLDNDWKSGNGLQRVLTVPTYSPGSTVGVRELKNQLSSFLDRVKAGEEITVTEHGRPIARLSPVGVDVDRMADLIAAGIVQPAASSQRQLPAKRVKLTDGSASLAEIVAGSRVGAR